MWSLVRFLNDALGFSLHISENGYQKRQKPLLVFDQPVKSKIKTNEQQKKKLFEIARKVAEKKYEVGN